MEGPLISVVIPIYKVEKYLEKCVTSVLAQPYKDMEVILVDDGSPDLCPKICDDFEVKDSRIKVIHKKNGGLSSARNAGIKIAKGDFLIFLDSDDYWTGDCCLDNIILRLQQNPDLEVLMHGCTGYFSDSGLCEEQHTGFDNNFVRTAPKNELLKYLFQKNLFPGAAWVTVIRRSFLLANSLLFIDGIKAEDIDWLINVFIHANKFDSTNDSFCFHLIGREGSIATAGDLKSIRDVMFTIDKWAATLKNNKDEYSQYLLGFLAHHFMCVVIIFNKLPNEYQQEAKELFKKHEFILKYATTKKDKFSAMIYKMFSLKCASQWYTVYHNRRRGDRKP